MRVLAAWACTAGAPNGLVAAPRPNAAMPPARNLRRLGVGCAGSGAQQVQVANNLRRTPWPIDRSIIAVLPSWLLPGIASFFAAAPDASQVGAHTKCGSSRLR